MRETQFANVSAPIVDESTPLYVNVTKLEPSNAFAPILAIIEPRVTCSIVLLFKNALAPIDVKPLVINIAGLSAVVQSLVAIAPVPWTIIDCVLARLSFPEVSLKAPAATSTVHLPLLGVTVALYVVELTATKLEIVPLVIEISPTEKSVVGSVEINITLIDEDDESELEIISAILIVIVGDVVSYVQLNIGVPELVFPYASVKTPDVTVNVQRPSPFGVKVAVYSVLDTPVKSLIAPLVTAICPSIKVVVASLLVNVSVIVESFVASSEDIAAAPAALMVMTGSVPSYVHENCVAAPFTSPCRFVKLSVGTSNV